MCTKYSGNSNMSITLPSGHCLPIPLLDLLFTGAETIYSVNTNDMVIMYVVELTCANECL